MIFGEIMNKLDGQIEAHESKSVQPVAPVCDFFWFRYNEVECNSPDKRPN